MNLIFKSYNKTEIGKTLKRWNVKYYEVRKIEKNVFIAFAGS